MTQIQKLEDSGERRTFSTGAVRDRGDLKPRPDLISPHAQMREGMVHTLGSQKYELRNWEQGLPISECLASAQRHIEQYKRGDINEDHIAQARWNLGAIIHFEEEIKAGRLPISLDDMPKYVQQEVQMDVIPPQVQRAHDMMGLYDIFEEKAQKIPSVETPQEEMPSHPEYPTISVQQESPTFYIAGPMRGYKNLNFPAFDEAVERGRQMGYRILSPADMDREHGIDPIRNPGSGAEAEKQLKDIIQRDINAIMSLQPERGDGVAVLLGWEDSIGTQAEVALAHWLGLKVILAADFHKEVE